MPVYLDLVVLLNFLVDFLLILGANRLCGHPPGLKRALLAGIWGGLYGGVCLLPRLAFLGNIFWRIISLGLMSILAFGVSLSALRRGVIFAFLSMALGGLALGVGGRGFWGILLPAACLFILCRVGFSARVGGRKLLPIELRSGEQCVRFTALEDTGNTLKDPLTGSSVLVVSAEIAGRLTGLTREQLRKPVENIGSLPGLRLIPYRAVGNSGGMLLAKRFQKVKVGAWQGSSLVAFAPDGLSPDGEYQGLIGGITV